MASQTANSTNGSPESPEVISLEQLVALTEKQPDEKLEFLGIVPVEKPPRELATAEMLDSEPEPETPPT